MVGFKLVKLKRVLVVDKLVIVFESTLDDTPPPVKYLTVNVVFDGEIPYVPEYRKFTGEYAVVSLVCLNGKPRPTLFAFGVISSSISFALPAPNWICRGGESCCETALYFL